MRRVAVAGVDAAGQPQRVHDDLAGDRVRAGYAVVLLGKVGQHHVGPELAQHARQPPHHRLGHQQHRVVGAEEHHVLDPQGGAGGAGLRLLDAGAFLHGGAQLVGGRDLVAVEHLLADDPVVHARSVGEHDAADPIAARGVVGHRAAGLIEDVGGVGADRQNPQWLVHAASMSRIARGLCRRLPIGHHACSA